VLGRRTIAVILSGGGSDGAAGAVALHDFGGTVIAADKASSAYPSMPEAAISRDDAVDYGLPAGDIPALLISLTRKHDAGRDGQPVSPPAHEERATRTGSVGSRPLSATASTG
jgi:chemotaxis response regulator CheB